MEVLLLLLIFGVLVYVVAWAAAWVFVDFVHRVGCLFTGRCERCGLYYADCPCDYD